MTTGRHLVHEAVYDDYVAALADKASHLPVGDPASGQVALGPIIDERQLGKVHALVTASTEAGARLAAAGPTRGCSTSPRCCPRSPRTCPRGRRRCSARSPP